MTDEREPKILVDEDWKAQVQAEKEAAQRRKEAGEKPSAGEQPGEQPAGEQPGEQTAGEQTSAEQAGDQPVGEERREKPPGESAHDDPPLPPASLPLLVTTLATQAMAALGMLPDPVEQRAVVRLNLAKHHIDTLGVLEEKTRGNLAADEAQMLADVLHQLRMTYVAASKR